MRLTRKQLRLLIEQQMGGPLPDGVPSFIGRQLRNLTDDGFEDYSRYHLEGERRYDVTFAHPDYGLNVAIIKQTPSKSFMSGSDSATRAIVYDEPIPMGEAPKSESGIYFNHIHVGDEIPGHPELGPITHLFFKK